MQLKDIKAHSINEMYDLVWTQSVLQYFESLDFAINVSWNMLQNFSRKEALLNAPTRLLQKESESVRSIAQAGYQARDELSHLYYEKQW